MSEQGKLSLVPDPVTLTVRSWWRWIVPDPNPAFITDEPFEISWVGAQNCGIRYRGTEGAIAFRKEQVLTEAEPIKSPERGGGAP